MNWYDKFDALQRNKSQWASLPLSLSQFCYRSASLPSYLSYPTYKNGIREQDRIDYSRIQKWKSSSLRQPNTTLSSSIFTPISNLELAPVHVLT
jgi:hypothetical protein